MREKIIAIVEQETGKENLTPEVRLDALGLDSLEFVSLMSSLQEVADIPDAEWSRLETIADLILAAEVHA